MTKSGRKAFLIPLKNTLSGLLMGSLLLFSSCDDKEVADIIAQASQTAEATPAPEDSGTQDQISEVAPQFSQDFEGFDLQRNWFLSDFDINSDSERSEYVTESKIKFALFWTKRARNLMADRLEIDRSLMTHEYTNSICEPKIEIGKESVYTNSDSDNLIAELDSDLNHCGISGQDPATLSLRSFIPTKIGYKYKLNVSYKMRGYGNQVAKSYKDLVVRFGSELEKFDPEYDAFKKVSLEMTSTQKFSKLVLTDNGLPDSYGVLIDDVEVRELGKAENYDSCAEVFQINSKGFKKCVLNEVSTEEICNFDSLEDTLIKYKEGAGVVENRKNTANAFVVEPATTGSINFLSLGLKGRVSMACKVGGYPALFDIFGKTLSMREISWGNVTPESYPELAKVRVKLEGCDEEILNRVNTVGTVQTAESFSVTFDENEDGLSYSGCKMSRLIIKDITPTGPSADGFDLNSVQFTE
jgi:hypothetical protein